MANKKNYRRRNTKRSGKSNHRKRSLKDVRSYWIGYGIGALAAPDNAIKRFVHSSESGIAGWQAGRGVNRDDEIVATVCGKKK